MFSKISISEIVFGHLGTMRNAASSKYSLSDLIVFIAIPIAAGILIFYLGWIFPENIYYTSTSVFGIFAGLLLNVQVAIFNIHNREWPSPSDAIELDLQADRKAARLIVLRELNVNIAYLIIVSALGIICSLVFYGLKNNSVIYSSIEMVIYVHFLLTFLMASKRSYLLFAQEYAAS